jgi:hypothetical protein
MHRLPAATEWGPRTTDLHVIGRQMNFCLAVGLAMSLMMLAFVSWLTASLSVQTNQAKKSAAGVVSTSK